MERVFVSCQISLGAFSGERVFEVQQVSGAKYIGLSPLHYCFHVTGEGFKPGEPLAGSSIEGRLAARKIAVEADSIRVAIPDGRAIMVRQGLVSQRC